MAKKETFLKNAPKARRRKKRNGPELVIYGAAGNPFKRRSRRNRRTLMAKRHKSRRTHRRKKNSWFDHAKQHATAARKGWRGRKRSKRSNPFRRSRRRHAARRGMRMNLPKIASGLIRLPSMQELLWVGVGSLGMPFINKTVTGLIPVDALKTGYGNIATEFVIGSVASGFARKFAGSTAGDVLFLLTLARVVGRVGYRLSNGTVGFEDADQLSAEGLEYYQPAQLSYSEVNPGFNGPDTPDSM